MTESNYYYYLKKFSFISLFTILAFSLQANPTKKIVINEFLAHPSSGNDWIELYNPGNEAINLNGWALTDNIKKINKWTFPSVTIEPGEYLVVYASGNDVTTGDELHTNFSLSRTGEYLGLIEADGVTIADEFAPHYPQQDTDISYGIYRGNGMEQYAYFTIPTKGSENRLGNDMLTPVFSKERGYYNETFQLQLSIADSDTKIYYTLDGDQPTTSSNLYSGPITISTTTPVSAVAVKDGKTSTIITHTYYFIKDILKQPKNPAGYPSEWAYLLYKSARATADYEMDPNICENPAYSSLMEEAFLSIPSVSIVTNRDNIFLDVNDEDRAGIYIFTGDSRNPYGNSSKWGRGWERPTSIEYINPVSGNQFQINCGIRLHGGNSRKPDNTVKHSFRVSFRKEYGSGKLRHNFYEAKTATNKFDRMVFRAGSNYSWMHGNEQQRDWAQYIIDSFARQTQISMGGLAPHDRFVHLYINGLYWGVYDAAEKVDNNFFEAYMGGDKEDYDIISNEYTGINDAGIVDGNAQLYIQMKNLATAGNYESLVSNNLLDMPAFIDYMLLHFYIGNMDWGKNNWYTGINRVNKENGFCFVTWDAENSLDFVDRNRIGTINGKEDTFEGALREILFGASKESLENGKGGLMSNSEFRSLFADRVQKHFFNGGVLTPEKTAELYEKLADEINLAIICESARWGDGRANMHESGVTETYTKNNHWLPRKEYLLTSYFPYRTEIVYNQLLDLGLITGLMGPQFNTKGGEALKEPFTIIITNPNGSTGEIYYTTNGDDPKGSNKEVSSSATKYTTSFTVPAGEITIKARIKTENEWSPLSEVIFANGPTVIDNEIIINPIDIYFANNSLHYNLAVEGNISIELFSMDGRKIMHMNEGYQTEGNHSTDYLELSEGSIYIYRVVFNNTVYTGKFRN